MESVTVVAQTRDPMFVPMPSTMVATSCYGAMTIQERLEPQRVPLPPATSEDTMLLTRDTLADTIQRHLAELVKLTSVQDSIGLPMMKKKTQLPSREEATACDNKPLANCNYKQLQFLPSAFDPNLKEIGEIVAKLTLQLTSNNDKWWKSSQVPLTCPLTGFPIKLLPYPPFKLKMPSSSSRILVDGKALALNLIATCNSGTNSWCLNRPDLLALGDYMHRCKLGPLRPDVAIALAEDIKSLNLSQAERDQSAQELNRMVCAAQAELKKLHWIQEQRLLRLYNELTGDASTVSAKSRQFGLRQTIPDFQL
jgi:hypothetical protein|mmetsp:Transcript_49413/g.78186  ORF Transcript_49413/g.78186 Transcript_49413/m.78186 type:complete len:310 (-) Transcript_49413:220-1149(-)